MPRAKRINLQLLAYLDALIEERSVTRAAQRAGIGQPAMSAALARLRTMFGDPLLVRTSSGMEPTPRALQLVKSVNQALHLIDAATREETPFDIARAERHFRIFASEGVAQLLIPGLLVHARKEAPGLRFTVRPADVRRMRDYLRDGDCDLMIAYVKTVPEDLRGSLLFRQRLVCIASSDHPTIRGKITLEQFVRCPQVVWGTEPVPFPSIEMLVDDSLAAMNRTREAAVRIPNVMLAPYMVASTDLIATVPERVARATARALSLQVLNHPLKLANPDLSMFWHDRLHKDEAHAWVRDVLRRVAAEAERRV